MPYAIFKLRRADTLLLKQRNRGLRMDEASITKIPGGRQEDRGEEDPILFENLLFDISNQLIQLPANGLGQAIERGLQRVVEFLD